MVSSPERFKPIPVRSPASSPLRFWLRGLLDLQLFTIARALRPAMCELPAGSVLDVGAGQAPWRDWLPGRCEYVGLDISNASDFGMTRPDGVVFYDGGAMPFATGTFYAALCIEVLEHAESPDLLLSEVARVLRPGAKLLLSVPWSARPHHLPFDFHRFTAERLRALLGQHGFANVQVEVRGNDLSVIANKLIVLSIDVAKSTTLVNAVATLPAALFFSVFAGVMLGLAHASMLLDLGPKQDPLGYFCTANRTDELRSE